MKRVLAVALLVVSLAAAVLAEGPGEPPHGSNRSTPAGQSKP
jgi:hypothetical protein